MPRRVRKLASQGQSPPQGLEKGKSYCENTKKPATSCPSYDPKVLLEESHKIDPIGTEEIIFKLT